MIGQRLAKLKIPDSPGVYTFKDAKGRPLYIGRATSLKDRVKSYFGADLIAMRGPRIVNMVTKARTVVWEKTSSVLEAVLLESERIKKCQPPYNVDERDNKSSQYVVITDELWPRVFLARSRDFDQAANEGRLSYAVKRRFGPYPESGLIKEALKILRKMFPFKDKKSFDPRHDAFYRALGRSPDDSDASARRRYLRTIGHLILFFEGKRGQLKTKLKRQMAAFSRQLKFEDAGEIKRLLYALEHINDIALVKGETVGRFRTGRQFRLEAYDVAHLGGMETVGAMAVSENGEPTPAGYRKFKLSRNRNDDVAGLAEILSRRLDHPEWPYPDVIVVDGNEVQKKRAEGILSARRLAIPVVAVTKDERHKADRLIGPVELLGRYKRDIVAVNAEAHRFAIKYHRKRRSKRVLS